jgi:hypothetical protein
MKINTTKEIIMNENEIEINGEIYVKKVSLESKDMPYVIVRTYSAGVFAGYLESYGKDREVNLVKARRLWYWDGAASLSQLAMEGVKRPENCKFPCEVDSIKLLEAIEIINTTEKSRKCIADVPVWKA